jgi:transposase
MKNIEYIDVRKLSIEERHLLKKQVANLLKKGKKSREIGEYLSLRGSTVRTYISEIKKNEGKVPAKPIMGRPEGSGTKLTAKEQTEIQKMIREKNPNQLKLKGFLWNLKNIAELIKGKYGITVAKSTMSYYLKRWGYTPQRPAIYNRKQNHIAVQKWLETEYPQIKEQAKLEKAEIYWGDEVGVQNECNYVRGFAPRGETPVLKMSEERFRVNMISAVNNQGKMKFMLYDEAFTQQLLIKFMNQLIKDSGRKVYLILDNLKVHHGFLVKEWVESHKEQIELFYLPSYSPELNPDEYFNGTLKRNLENCGDSKDYEALKKNVKNTAFSIQRRPSKIANLFHADKVKYAA